MPILKLSLCLLLGWVTSLDNTAHYLKAKPVHFTSMVTSTTIATTCGTLLFRWVTLVILTSVSQITFWLASFWLSVHLCKLCNSLLSLPESTWGWTDQLKPGSFWHFVLRKLPLHSPPSSNNILRMSCAHDSTWTNQRFQEWGILYCSIAW